jgi:4-amino-4-deoxy-L-arabinose transferase-like glycosyltransferase
MYDREPGMSFFLVPIYALFGIENPYGLSIVQLSLVFLSAWFFCTQASRHVGERAAGICFLLLLTSGSIFHTIFSAYRECLALSLLMIFSGLFLSSEISRAWRKTLLMGVVFGSIILTYYPFIFFPPALLCVWRMRRMTVRDAAVVILVCYCIVSLWCLRNYLQGSKFRVIDDRRTAVMWYVRGEQAEHIRGIEPFMCLWAEYVSRDWANRAHQCSFNGLMHERWPDGVDFGADYSEVVKESQAKIRANVGSYLWFSVVDTLELHLPFLGGGWSRAYNVYAAISMLILYVGFAFGFMSLLRREYALFAFLIGYNIAIFILTDATPRYLLPVIFCYALIAGIGYDYLLVRMKRQS